MKKTGVLALMLGATALSTAAAAEAPITISANPTVVAFGAPSGISEVGGFVAGSRADEEVVLEAKGCGDPGFVRVAAQATDAQGGWHFRLAPAIATTYRARWNGNPSETVTVRVRPAVRLEQGLRKRFDVLTIALRFFDGSVGRLERFAGGRWVLVRRVRLARTSGPRGAGWAYSKASFGAPVVKRGWLLRFVLPRFEVGPCYLAGFSMLWRAT